MDFARRSHSYRNGTAIILISKNVRPARLLTEMSSVDDYFINAGIIDEISIWKPLYLLPKQRRLRPK